MSAAARHLEFLVDPAPSTANWSRSFVESQDPRTSFAPRQIHLSNCRPLPCSTTTAVRTSSVMNVAPLVRRPLGCLKASLRRTRQQKSMFTRHMASEAAQTTTTTATKTPPPEHGFCTFPTPFLSPLPHLHSYQHPYPHSVLTILPLPLQSASPTARPKRSAPPSPSTPPRQ